MNLTTPRHFLWCAVILAFLDQCVAAPFLGYALECPVLDGTNLGEIFFKMRKAKSKTITEYKLQDKIEKKSIMPSRPTKFIIHGWKTSSKSKWNEMMAEKLHSQGNNVIQLDWSYLIVDSYNCSARIVRKISNVIAKAINRMNTGISLKLSSVHLIGYDIGAHIAGRVGYRFVRWGRILGRITGLDPAGPVFSYELAIYRLSYRNALFVDTVHTDMGIYGIEQNLGHVNFYMNSGYALQPGCPEVVIKTATFEEMTCSHLMSVYFFIDSIGSQKYTGTACFSYEGFKKGLCKKKPQSIFGNELPKDQRGFFYVDWLTPPDSFLKAKP